jgi:hypothetical protein
MRPPVHHTALLAALLWLNMLAPSCGRADRNDNGRRSTALPEPEELLSEPLMIALAQARNYHHKADVLLKDGKVEAAITAVRNVLSTPFPAGSPEKEDVQLDARARLAKLLLRRPQPAPPAGADGNDEALAVVDAGLASHPRHSFYLANLFRVRGEILEVRADDTEVRDAEAARALRVKAIDAFDQSIALNEELLKKLAREPAP